MQVLVGGSHVCDSRVLVLPLVLARPLTMDVSVSQFLTWPPSYMFVALSGGSESITLVMHS